MEESTVSAPVAEVVSERTELSNAVAERTGGALIAEVVS